MFYKVKKWLLLAGLLTIGSQTLANSLSHYWINKSQPLHTSTINFSQDKLTVEASLHVGLGDASNCRLLKVIGTITIQDMVKGFMIYTGKDSFPKTGRFFFTCAEEHYRTETNYTTKIAFSLTNDGKEYTQATPNRHVVELR